MSNNYILKYATYICGEHICGEHLCGENIVANCQSTYLHTVLRTCPFGNLWRQSPAACRIPAGVNTAEYIAYFTRTK